MKRDWRVNLQIVANGLYSYREQDFVLYSYYCSLTGQTTVFKPRDKFKKMIGLREDELRHHRFPKTKLVTCIFQLLEGLIVQLIEVKSTSGLCNFKINIY